MTGTSPGRICLDGDKIMISWTPNNLSPHHELVKRVSRAVRKAGYPIVLTERMGIATNSHMWHRGGRHRPVRQCSGFQLPQPRRQQLVRC
jgi:hypothetical protein